MMGKKYKFYIVVIVLILTGIYADGQQIKAFSQDKKQFLFASKPERSLKATYLKNNIDSLIEKKVDPFQCSDSWQGAFWAMQLMLYKPEKLRRLIPSFIQNLSSGSAEYQRSFLEMLYTLYPNDFAKKIKQEWRKLDNAKNQAMALEYLLLSGLRPRINPSDKISGTDWLVAYIKRKHPSLQKPAQKDFTDTSFLAGKVVLCSFQSSDRNIPGYLMIRTSNGSWLADDDRKVIKIPQLARSISNLPYYLTNGNTPQGLYRITGTDISENKWIGPTTNIQMVMPFENNHQFFQGNRDYEMYYKTLLGEILGKVTALYEAYYAGKLGRSEIIAHGTTIDPEFYRGQNFYPCTPSLGCLCSPEIWDEDGRISYSAQQQILDALIKNNLTPEWLIVAEISDFQPPEITIQ
ncbi:MAG: hypothetical protein WAT46_02030 [Saprospiraceae bacterium]